MRFSARRARSEDAAFIERLFSLPHVERILQDARTGEFKNLCPYGMLESEYRERSK